MVVKNSALAYQEIKRNGLLSKRRFEVYECIVKYGPITMSDCLDKLGLKRNQSGRFSELEEAEVVFQMGSTIDNKTNMTVSLYRSTGNLPKEIKKKPSKSKQKIQDLEDKLERVQKFYDTPDHIWINI